MKFCCPNCGYEPKPDKKKSNDNWKVFDCGNCPTCKTKMRINFATDLQPDSEHTKNAK